MILLGCLLAFGAAVAPRVILILAWIFSNRWPLVWQGDFLIPLLGIIFLPYTMIMYMLAYQVPVGVEGWEWMWVILGLFLDLWKYSQMWANRQQAMSTAQQYYPAGSSGASTSTSATTSSAAARKTAPAPSAPASEPETAEEDSATAEDKDR